MEKLEWVSSIFIVSPCDLLLYSPSLWQKQSSIKEYMHMPSLLPDNADKQIPFLLVWMKVLIVKGGMIYSYCTYNCMRIEIYRKTVLVLPECAFHQVPIYCI